MARTVLTRRAMYLIRQLTQSGPTVYERSTNCRDPLGNASSATGGVHEVAAEDLRLSSVEIAQRLDDRLLHSTDLVMIGGTWTTLAQSIPFCELAEPHARRESRERTLKGALLLLASVSAWCLIFFLRIWLATFR